MNVTPGAFEDDEWVEVTGTIYPLGREVIVLAAASGGIVDVDRPEPPVPVVLTAAPGRSRSGRAGDSTAANRSASGDVGRASAPRALEARGP